VRINLQLSHKALLLVAIPLVFQFVFVAILGILFEQAEYERDRQRHSTAVLAEANSLNRLFVEAISSLISFGITRSQSFSERYDRVMTEIPREFRTLNGLVNKNTRQLSSLNHIQQIGERVLAILARAKAGLDGQSEHLAAFQLAYLRKDLEKTYEQLSAALTQFVEEERILHPVDPEAEKRAEFFIQISLGAGLLLSVLMAVGLAAYFTAGTSRRLKTLMDNNFRLVQGKPLNPQVSGGDEIAVLDETFHVMAETLSEASRKERAVVDNALDVICSIDGDGRFLMVNPACARTWGYAPEELVGRRYADIVCEEDVEQTVRTIQQAVKEKSESTFENRIRHKQKQIVFASWSVHWSDRERSLFCVVHDITAQKEMDQLKKEFVSMITHDLRSPLTSVKITCEALLKGIWGQLAEAGIAQVKGADRSLKRLIGLINDLLDVEKMEAGKFNLDVEPVRLSTVIDRSIESLGGYAEQNDVSIKVQLPPELCEAEILGDRDRLVQVLVNLVSNAVKYSPRGSVVSISATVADGLTEIRVTDQGIGIPEEFQSAIFSRFEQVSLPEALRKNSSGLGLAICKAIVEAHKGTIGVKSEPGAGSTFWFRVPSYRDCLLGEC
jgi:PAS domain S-box-containing protein